jgi:uncharacterized membrane-anchored protein
VVKAGAIKVSATSTIARDDDDGACEWELNEEIGEWYRDAPCCDELGKDKCRNQLVPSQY